MRPPDPPDPPDLPTAPTRTAPATTPSRRGARPWSEWSVERLAEEYEGFAPGSKAHLPMSAMEAGRTLTVMDAAPTDREEVIPSPRQTAWPPQPLRRHSGAVRRQTHRHGERDPPYRHRRSWSSFGGRLDGRGARDVDAPELFINGASMRHPYGHLNAAPAGGDETGMVTK